MNHDFSDQLFPVKKGNDHDNFYAGYTDSKTSKNYISCYETHKALKIGDFEVYGGNAQSPVVSTDIFVTLDIKGENRCGDPWEDTQWTELVYYIQDMGVPKEIDRFKAMVTYLCNQLQKGKSVHVGCFGGHGRTGLVLTALVAEMTGEKDAIQYVRKNYCKKAVESKSQVQFLMKHYGVTEAKPTKGDVVASTVKGGWESVKGTSNWKSGQYKLGPVTLDASVGPVKYPDSVVTKSAHKISSIESPRNIWKK